MHRDVQTNNGHFCYLVEAILSSAWTGQLVKMNSAVLHVVYVLLGLCALLLLLGSGLIFMGFMKYPDLRTGPNFLIIPVQLASILFVFTNIISRLSFAFPKIILDEETCQILRSVTYSLTPLSGMLLAFIGLQRYLIFVKRKTVFSGHLTSTVAILLIFGQSIGTACFLKMRMQDFQEEYNITAMINTNSSFTAQQSAIFSICPHKGQTYNVLMPFAAIIALVGLTLGLPMILQFFCYTQIWREINRKQNILRYLKKETSKHSRRAIQRLVMLHRSWIGIFVSFFLWFIPYLGTLSFQSKVSSLQIKFFRNQASYCNRYV